MLHSQGERSPFLTHRWQHLYCEQTLWDVPVSTCVKHVYKHWLLLLAYPELQWARVWNTVNRS